MSNNKITRLVEFVRDLVVEPERLSNPDEREKTLFEAKELLKGLKCQRCGHKALA